MTSPPLEVATLGGGCFWCLDAVYRQIKGVERVTSGYAGGDAPNPTYEAVCGGETGHVEVVRVEFDPQVISYRDILQIFFSIHDPTTMDRQGNDIGSQYRSVIFHHSPEQEHIAEQLVDELTREQLWDRPIVTQLLPAPEFYPAEDYHQDFFMRNPGQGYCRYVIAPKVAKFRRAHLERLRA